MAQDRDYYEVLGVPPDAPQDDIKRAFRRLARRFHPDVKPDDPEAEARFKEVAQAYEVLRDPERRAYYDRYGTAGPAGPATADFWGEFAGVGDLFEAFFGPRRTAYRAGPRPGSDLRYDIEIALEEVASGVEKAVTLERLTSCDKCDGTGSRGKSTPEVCAACGGTGQVQHTTATPFGRLSTVTACPRCAGEGRAAKDPCQACRGSGRRAAEAEVSVHIPAGIEEGGMVRVAGQGEAGERGARAGDLYVVAHVKPHPVFERRGRDLRCELPIPFTVAALGGTVLAPTLSEPEELHVPPGTQTGETFVLRGSGLPDARTGVRGSELVTVRVVTPTKLSKRQRDLLAEFAGEGGDEIDDPRGWMERIRAALRGEEEG